MPDGLPTGVYWPVGEHLGGAPAPDDPKGPSGTSPAMLRPELLPGVEVVEVLPAVGYPAILYFEDEAAGDIQPLAVPRRAVVMNADHAAIVSREHALQCGLELSLIHI